MDTIHCVSGGVPFGASGVFVLCFVSYNITVYDKRCYRRSRDLLCVVEGVFRRNGLRFRYGCCFFVRFQESLTAVMHRGESAVFYLVGSGTVVFWGGSVAAIQVIL